MSNIVSKLTFKNVSYDLADESARSAVNNLENQLNATRDDLQNMIAAVGSPLVAATTSAMTDTTKIYVYTGTTTTVSGVTFTAGNWYYYDTKWELGGTYNETALETDTTLKVSGHAADAKVVGDALEDIIADEYSTTSLYSVGDYCLHNEKLYRCITEISVAEEWTSSHWTLVNVTGEVTNLKDSLSDPLNLLYKAKVIKNRYFKQTESGYIKDYDYFIVPVESGQTYYIYPGCRYFSKYGQLIYENKTDPFSYVSDFTGNIYITFSRNVPGWIMTKEQDYSTVRPFDTPSFFVTSLKQSTGNSTRFPMSQKGVTDAIASQIGDKFQLGKNLVNPNERIEGAVNAFGTITTEGAWGAYLTSDFIPLEPNTQYVFSIFADNIVNTNRKVLMLFNASKAAVSGTFLNQTGVTEISFNSGSSSYVRLSAQNWFDFQLEKGSSRSDYAPFLAKYELITALGAAPQKQVKDLIHTAISSFDGGTKTVIKSGDAITVETKMGGKTLQRNYSLSYGNNHVLNFRSAVFDGITVRGNSDDITPQRIKVNDDGGVTVGANHGWPVVLKANAGDLTEADVGSVWSDGITTYTLVSVDSGYVYFCPPISKTGGIIYVTATPAVSDLQHVSGATHTASISLSSLSVDQLYPSVNNHSAKLYLDGKDISNNGTYNANKIEIEESYGIIDLYELVVYARAHIGNVNLDNVTSIVTLHYKIEITSNAEVIYSNLVADEHVHINNSGFLQAEATAAVGGTLYRYVNGVASGTFASQSLVDMTNYNSNKVISNSDVRTNQVPNRAVDLCVGDNNKTIYGFAIGFVPDMGDGADNKRQSNTTMWDMRGTKKSYPYCIQDKDLEAGEQLNIVGYRVYLPEQGMETDKYLIIVGNAVYCFVDAHRAISGSFSSGELGCEVSPINSDSISIGDHVGGNGVSYYSGSTYSAGVAKIHT